jgi:hypothetical protein
MLMECIYFYPYTVSSTVRLASVILNQSHCWAPIYIHLNNRVILPDVGSSNI